MFNFKYRVANYFPTKLSLHDTGCPKKSDVEYLIIPKEQAGTELGQSQLKPELGNTLNLDRNGSWDLFW